MSKNNIGARSTDLNISLCKLRDALRQDTKPNTDLTTVINIDPPTIAPNIPIHWLVVRSKLEVSSNVTLSSRGEQLSPSVALSKERFHTAYKKVNSLPY